MNAVIPRKNSIIGIIGNGALGHALKVLFHQSHVDCELLGRDQMFSTSPKVVFFTVKSYQLEEALSEHLVRLEDNAIVIYIGNGWLVDHLNLAQKNYLKLTIRVGSSTVGSTKTAQGFEIRGNGKIVWGALNNTPCTEEEKKLISKVASLGWKSDILPVIRTKWLFNSSLNTICGVFGLPTNSEVLRFHNEMRLLFDEAFLLGEKKWGPWQEPRETYWQQLLSLIEATRNNENSMAQDVRLGTKTEVAFLTGFADNEKEFPIMHRFTKILKDKENHATKGL